MAQYFATITAADKVKILKANNTTPEMFQQDIATIWEWLKSQPHLPQIFTERHLQLFLIMNKCSIEVAKTKIDMYLSLRNFFPEIFQNNHPFSSRIQYCKKFIYVVISQNLTSDFVRLVTLKIKDASSKLLEVDPEATYAYIHNHADVRLVEDMFVSNSMLFDMEHVKLHYLKRVTPMMIKKFITITENTLTTRVNGFHIINAPSYMENFIIILKSLIKPKLAERFFIHEDLESLQKEIPKVILPKDYGGDEKSLDELEDLYSKKFEEHKNYFDQRETMEVNEDLRPEKIKNCENLGFHGNFKKLNVD